MALRVKPKVLRNSDMLLSYSRTSFEPESVLIPRRQVMAINFCTGD